MFLTDVFINLRIIVGNITTGGQGATSFYLGL